MKTFFEVITIEDVMKIKKKFMKVKKEKITISNSLNRYLGESIFSDINIPSFDRSTMDGFAIKSSSSFGCSYSNPAYLEIVDEIEMGTFPNISISEGQCAKIATGGAMPKGADSVIMEEHVNKIDDHLIEIYKIIPPGNHVIFKGDDFKKNEFILNEGDQIRPQEMGLLASSGNKIIKVFKKPTITLISTGNEIIPIDQRPLNGQIRDINAYTLIGEIIKGGGIPKYEGIIKDNFDDLRKACIKNLELSDIVIISGGSSIGKKDLTIEVLKSIDKLKILFHGISISPGKPTILGKYKNKQIWGLPGHPTSAMIVFKIIVLPFLKQISGKNKNKNIIPSIDVILNRNISSLNGREDYIRVKLYKKNNKIIAEPILGKSGLLNTMIKADGLIKVDVYTEGLYKGSLVKVFLF